VLLVDTLVRRQFSRREVRLGQALVLQAANALSNARLYRDLELSLEELHRTQSKLVQTARLSAMGELAAAVAHQINNPLTTVLGDSELILRDLLPEDQNFEAIQAIHRAGKRAHEVVRRLLAMARQQQPTDERLEKLDINETILNTLTLVKSHILHVNIALSVELGDNLPLAAGIQGQLEDVWLNLLLNARDGVAGCPGPKIGIRTMYDPDQDAVKVTIWDNGTGIPAEIQDHIFEPLYTTKPAGEGTGLGLHICRQIIEKCQGSIRLESAYNQGTRFEIYLPVSTQNENE
jgi:two-component system NtrC family sensor kinase